MAKLPPPWDAYPDAEGFESAWSSLAADAGAAVAVAGTSVEGRPIRRYDFGPKNGVAVLFTGLVHGVELVGSVALFESLRAMVTDRAHEGLRDVRLVVVPVVNPDALHANSARIASG